MSNNSQTPTELTQENFCEQMFRYGFLYEQIPRCFHSNSFANHGDELLQPINTAEYLNPRKRFTADPFTMSIYKSPYSRRTISIPNPKTYAIAVKFMGENWPAIKGLAQSENSQSPITFLLSYDEQDFESINCESLRETNHARSDFVANTIERNVLSQGLTTKLSIDLQTFYDSIYTHAITWSICGKQEAKRYHTTKRNPAPSHYDFADKLDILVRNMKSGETNGILTGPYTSRIFSELLLSGIDGILREKDYVFRRYVDDHSFYFESESQAQQALPDIESVMRDFGLKINHEKTLIEKFPFDTLSNMKTRLNEALTNGGIYSLLNEASRLHLEGEKGAYKYALKMIRDKELPNDCDAELALLFNIGLSNPQHCRFVTSYLYSNTSVIDDERLSTSLNSLLLKALNAQREQDFVNLLSMGKELCLPLAGEAVLRALELDNDLSRIISLDYWLNANSLVARTTNEAKDINEAVRTLAEQLKGSDYRGEHWLLLFEAERWSSFDVTRSSSKADDFFASMKERDISFYSSVEKPSRFGVSSTIGDFYKL